MGHIQVVSPEADEKVATFLLFATFGATFGASFATTAAAGCLRATSTRCGSGHTLRSSDHRFRRYQCTGTEEPTIWRVDGCQPGKGVGLRRMHVQVVRRRKWLNKGLGAVQFWWRGRLVDVWGRLNFDYIGQDDILVITRFERLPHNTNH